MFSSLGANLVIKSHFCSRSAIFCVHLRRTYFAKVFFVIPFMEMWQFSRQKDSGMLVARIEYAVMPIIYGLILHINPSVEYFFVCLCLGSHDLHKDER